MLLNGPVKPRLPVFFKGALDDLHVLFCYESRIKPRDTFQPYHFVPLLFYTNQHKRKPSGVQSTSSIKKTKLWQHRIFTASKMPLSQPILNKAPLRDFPLLQPLRPVPLRLLNLLNIFLQRL